MTTVLKEGFWKNYLVLPMEYSETPTIITEFQYSPQGNHFGFLITYKGLVNKCPRGTL